MQFGTHSIAHGRHAPTAPFATVAPPLALTERAGDGAPAWFEPDDAVDLWADVRPVVFTARPRALPSGPAPASALMSAAGSVGVVPDPAPLVSTAPATPVHLPRPVVAVVSVRDRTAPDAAVVTLRPPDPLIAAPATTTLVISA